MQGYRTSTDTSEWARYLPWTPLFPLQYELKIDRGSGYAVTALHLLMLSCICICKDPLDTVTWPATVPCFDQWQNSNCDTSKVLKTAYSVEVISSHCFWEFCNSNYNNNKHTV